MTVIQDREYVQKDEGKFKPTELGSIVNDLLIDSFADLFDIAYTAKMEENLDKVEDGQQKWTDVMQRVLRQIHKRPGIGRNPHARCQTSGNTD